MDESERDQKYLEPHFVPSSVVDGGGARYRVTCIPLSIKLVAEESFSAQPLVQTLPACLHPFHPGTHVLQQQLPLKSAKAGNFPVHTNPFPPPVTKAYSSPLHPHPQAQATSIIMVVPPLGGLISTTMTKKKGNQSRRHHAIFSHPVRLIARYKTHFVQRGEYSG